MEPGAREWSSSVRLEPRIAPQHRLGTGQPFVGGGIPPVLRRTDETPLHGIVMQVLQLLPQDIVAEDGLRMGAFLPDLILVGLMRGAEVAELMEQPFATFGG